MTPRIRTASTNRSSFSVRNIRSLWTCLRLSISIFSFYEWIVSKNNQPFCIPWYTVLHAWYTPSHFVFYSSRYHTISYFQKHTFSEVSAAATSCALKIASRFSFRRIDSGTCELIFELFFSCSVIVHYQENIFLFDPENFYLFALWLVIIYDE